MPINTSQSDPSPDILAQLYGINPQEFGYNSKRADQYMVDHEEIYANAPDRELDEDDLDEDEDAAGGFNPAADAAAFGVLASEKSVFNIINK